MKWALILFVFIEGNPFAVERLATFEQLDNCRAAEQMLAEMDFGDSQIKTLCLPVESQDV